VFRNLREIGQYHACEVSANICNPLGPDASFTVRERGEQMGSRSSGVSNAKWNRLLVTLRPLAGKLIAVVVAIGVSYSQGRVNGPDVAPHSGEKRDDTETNEKRRRLESLTWNPTTSELTWVISEGHRTAGNYLPVTRATYLIHVDSAMMQFNGEHRRINGEEAKNVNAIMSILSEYAIGSTIRWEMGPGKEPDDRKEPAPPKKEEKDAPDITKLPGRKVTLVYASGN
jgi:hypothetical protein